MKRKRKLKDRTRSLEGLRIMRRQELDRQMGNKIEIPDYVIERIEKAKMEIDTTQFLTFEDIERRLGIIRYGKRGIAFRQPRGRIWKIMH